MVTMAAGLAGGAAAAAEWLHRRRVRRAARLAFGPGGRPRLWTMAASALRVLGMALATWGALVLYLHDPLEGERIISPRARQQLLVCLDVSPSMLIEDAGRPGETTSRARRAGKLVNGILDRVSEDDTRFSLVAFYTGALPMLQTSSDKNVLANMLDGLPMYVAFEPGPTHIEAGVREACRMCKPWGRKSTTLIVISDGDAAAPSASYSLPAAIADVLVIGVGDSSKATMVGGHASRQDVMSLKQLAARLGGTYHDGNRSHVPTSVLRGLSMVTPHAGMSMGVREAGLAAFITGAGLVSLVTPALMLLGIPRSSPSRQRRLPAEHAARLGDHPRSAIGPAPVTSRQPSVLATETGGSA